MGSKIGNSAGFISHISSLCFFQLLRGLYRRRRSSSQPFPVLLDLQVSCSPTAPLCSWASENVGPETGMEKAAGIQRLSRNRDEDDVKLLLYRRRTYRPYLPAPAEVLTHPHANVTASGPRCHGNANMPSRMTCTAINSFIVHEHSHPPRANKNSNIQL